MKSYILIVAVIGFTVSYPIEEAVEDSIDVPADLGEYVIEGDMIIPLEQYEILHEKVNPKHRNAIKDPNRLWPGGIVYYKFDDDMPNDYKNLIRSAMWEIEVYTCIKYKAEPNSTYIHLTHKATGCSAVTGRIPVPSGTKVHLGNGCMHKGIIIHELLHSLGFYHQQNSANRDDYVKINDANIKKNFTGNFIRYTIDQVTDLELPYDYESIMHYGAYDFSSNNLPTITALKSGGDKMGQRERLTDTDYRKINKLYENECTPEYPI